MITISANYGTSLSIINPEISNPRHVKNPNTPRTRLDEKPPALATKIVLQSKLG